MVKKVIPIAIKPFQELTLADDFMFGEVMRRPENAKPFLEALLGKKIGSITAIDKQKELTDGAALHGVRLDVCLEDENQTQYDVEMQTGASYDLEKRIRYYQSSIDRRTLKSAESYRELRQSFVIFICTDDYYRRGLAVYRRKSVIEGAEDIVYDDGSRAYILNASFTEGNSSGEVLDFLRYIDAGYRGKPLNVQSEYVAQIERAVEDVKTDEEMEGTYMTIAMKLQDVRWEGRQEGRQEGEQANRLANLKALMENLGIPADKAMDLLNVPASDRPKYRQMLDES